MTQPKTDIREFNLATDLSAVERIWREVGWVDEDEVKQVETFFSCGHAMVATIDDVAECSVHITDGQIRLQQADLPLCIVTAVTTSRIARGHAFAKRLTALQLQNAVSQGMDVAALGMFDQGFYDLLGFGSGGYDHYFSFDPANLRVNERVPTPRRLGVDDYADIHQAMANRSKVHGSVVVQPESLMKAELNWSDNGFGLGYGPVGGLTHFLWFSSKEAERGPYRVSHIAYQNTDQLMQLLGLLKSLSDQVYSVKMFEPPEIRLQDLLHRPFRNAALSEKGPHAAEHESFAWWQLRILNLPNCIGAFTSRLDPVRFTLRVTDPVEEILQREGNEGDWLGVAGTYDIELGQHSSATPSQHASHPILECSVNALTRLMFGVAPASSLALTDDLAGPTDLLDQLDEMISLRTPHTGWDF